ncbi:hypothetical protein BDV19DRAFT_395575 [Aspergillus venezuelensis]
MGQVPEPLIEHDAFGNSAPASATRRSLENNTSEMLANASSTGHSIGYKGPLFNLPMALFGEGSIADVQRTALTAYAHSGRYNGTPEDPGVAINAFHGTAAQYFYLFSGPLTRGPLAAGHVEPIRAPDETLGWTGNAAEGEGEGEVEMLCLGGVMQVMIPSTGGQRKLLQTLNLLE